MPVRNLLGTAKSKTGKFRVQARSVERDLPREAFRAAEGGRLGDQRGRLFGTQIATAIRRKNKRVLLQNKMLQRPARRECSAVLSGEQTK